MLLQGAVQGACGIGEQGGVITTCVDDKSAHPPLLPYYWVPRHTTPTAHTGLPCKNSRSSGWVAPFGFPTIPLPPNSTVATYGGRHVRGAFVDVLLFRLGPSFELVAAPSLM